MRRILLGLALLFALATPVAAQGCGSGNPNCVAPTPPAGDSSNRIATTAFITHNIGSGTFTPTPNFQSTINTTALVIATASNAAPSNVNDPVVAISKVTNSTITTSVNQALYVGISKLATANLSRATAVFGEAVDQAGGAGSFVEGGRFHGLVNAGTGGSGYGVIASGENVASTATTYVIGLEGEVINKNADAPTTFNPNAFTASVTGTANGTHTADAAFIIGPFTPSTAEFRVGYYVPAGFANTPVSDSAFKSDANTVWGLNLTTATGLFGAVGVPNNVPTIRAVNASGSTTLNLLSLDNTNSLLLGPDAGIAFIKMSNGSAPFFLQGAPISGGALAASSLSLLSTTNGAPSGDVLSLGASTITATATGGAHVLSVSATNTLTLTGLTTGTNADFLCLSSGGVVLIQASACTISSLRFKPDWTAYHGDALATLDRLHTGTFHLALDRPNADRNGDRLQLGLNAENLAAVAPECAIFEDDGVTPKSYRQECVIALLVRGLQQLRGQK